MEGREASEGDVEGGVEATFGRALSKSQKDVKLRPVFIFDRTISISYLNFILRQRLPNVTFSHAAF